MRTISTIAIHHSQNRKTIDDIKNLHVNKYKWDDIFAQALKVYRS